MPTQYLHQPYCTSFVCSRGSAKSVSVPPVPGALVHYCHQPERSDKIKCRVPDNGNKCITTFLEDSFTTGLKAM